MPPLFLILVVLLDKGGDGVESASTRTISSVSFACVIVDRHGKIVLVCIYTCTHKHACVRGTGFRTHTCNKYIQFQGGMIFRIHFVPFLHSRCRSTELSGFMTSPNFTNVILDLHEYNAFDAIFAGRSFAFNNNYVNSTVSTAPNLC